MGVYIKSMEMPASCAECALNYDCFKCIVTGTLFFDHKHHFFFDDEMTRLYNCPLVLVPPHGRLIDADKQDAQIEALIERHLHGYTKSTWDFVCELRDILKHNPTVIPKEPTTAEEEKNDK